MKLISYVRIFIIITVGSNLMLKRCKIMFDFVALMLPTAWNLLVLFKSLKLLKKSQSIFVFYLNLMKRGVLMKLPKTNRAKYRSVKRFKARGLRKLESSLQLDCYYGYFDFTCGSRRLCRSCWFKGCKPVKE